MKVLGASVILALFLCAMGCGGGGNADLNSSSANTALENSNSPKTNVEELGLIVNVPYEAEDIAWKEAANHKQLIAVLRFSNEDSDKIVAEASARQAPQSVSLSTEPWFPAELIAQGDMSGDDSLKGLAYAADGFFQEPYTSGRITRVEGTDYFIVELSAK